MLKFRFDRRIIVQGVSVITLGTFRFYYEYEIEYEYDFSNLVCVVQITACRTNLVS